jgi:hypothetical protein
MTVFPGKRMAPLGIASRRIHSGQDGYRKTEG